MPQERTVLVSEVRMGPQYHPTRLDTDPTAVAWVNYYRECIRNGVKLDPIIVDARLFIVDGHHRWRAHVLENVKTIRVIVSATGGWPV